jgi:hypothetical protein
MKIVRNEENELITKTNRANQNITNDNFDNFDDFVSQFKNMMIFLACKEDGKSLCTSDLNLENME